MVVERGDEFERATVGDRVSGLNLETAGEDGDAPEESAFPFGQEFVTPGDGIPHGPLTVGEIASATGKHVQSMLEPG